MASLASLYAAFLVGHQVQVCVDRAKTPEYFSDEPFFSTDDHGDFLTQVLFQFRHGFSIAGMQFFGGVEHGRIGEFKGCFTGHGDKYLLKIVGKLRFNYGSIVSYFVFNYRPQSTVSALNMAIIMPILGIKNQTGPVFYLPYT
jgi:hypothetical protein